MKEYTNNEKRKGKRKKSYWCENEMQEALDAMMRKNYYIRNG